MQTRGQSSAVQGKACPLTDCAVNITCIGVHRSKWLIIPHKIREHTKTAAGASPVSLMVRYVVITVTAWDITAYTDVNHCSCGMWV